MRPLILSVLSTLLLSCKDDKPPIHKEDLGVPAEQVHAAQPKVNLEIIAGKSIGNVALEQNTQALAFLGPADLSDAAMGKSWQTWYSAHSKLKSGATGEAESYDVKSELNIYDTYKDNELKEKVVRQIRITSADFKTPQGLGAGSTFDAISGSYAMLDLLGSYTKPSTTNTIELYDVTNLGIAFEIANTGSEKICVAVIVHAAGKKATEEYRYFRPDLVKP